MTVVEAVLDHAAAERARLVTAARATLLRSAGAVTIEVLAEATDRKVGTARQWVRRQREAGRLVTVTHDGVVLVPTFQLDDGFDLDAEAADVVAGLVAHQMSGWAVWDWFTTPNTWLDDATPMTVFAAGDLAAVRRAATGLFQE
ncbi:MAG: hypothetical protein ACR2JF_09045 [Iamia sp.]